MSTAQKHLKSPNRAKQYELSPTLVAVLHVPQKHAPFVHTARQMTPLQSCEDVFFLQRSIDADARELVRTGAAHAAAPAIPMLRSTSRREILFSSMVSPS
jgi:hypothetical protein